MAENILTQILNGITSIFKSESKEATAIAKLQGSVDNIAKRQEEHEVLRASSDQAILESLGRIETRSAEILDISQRLLTALVPGPAVRVFFQLSDPETGEILFEGESPLQANQSRRTKIHVTVVLKDADGNQTKLDQVDTPSTVDSANPAITIQNFDVNAMEFDMITGGLAGVGPISLNGDANLKPGETTPFTGKIDMVVPPGDAVVAEFQLGAEEPVV